MTALANNSGELADMRLTVTIEEAAKMLGVGRSCAYSAVKAGDFPVPVIHVGRRLLVSRHALEELLGVPARDPENAESRAEKLGSRTTLGLVGAEGRGPDKQ